MGLIHPRILHMEHSLEETKDYISFATEQIFGNLENVVTDESLDRLEIKLGVLQVKIEKYSLKKNFEYITDNRWNVISPQLSKDASRKSHSRRYLCNCH